MAGGKGTRLRLLTNDEIPKPMAPVAGKPILQWQVECLREQKVANIIMVVGHLGEKIQEYFQDGSGFGVNIQYISETMPLGTAGALSMLPPLLTEENFFLVFGDVLFDIDLERMMRFHMDNRAMATLFVHPNAHPFDSDLVIYDGCGRVQRFDSKHNVRNYWYRNCVNAGFYLLNREICREVPPQTKVDLEKDLLSRLIEAGTPVYAYPSSEYIKDVGTVERIRLAEAELKSGLVRKRSLRKKQRAIFLDRDGTVNRKKGLVYQEDQFELEDGTAEAIRKINQSGYLAIIVTNQPVVARGLCEVDDVERIHRKMETLLGREGAYLDIGMLEACAEQFNIDLQGSWTVGDTTVDIQTGKNAGTHTALVLTGDAGQDGKFEVTADLVCEDLLQAVEQILERSGEHD